MAISKVVYKSSPSATPVTWMDATTATAAAADIASPKTAMLADGVMTTGTGTGGGGVSVTVEQLPGGGEHYIISGDGGDTNPTAEEKDVNFIDYDGTIRYSYTAAEAQALEALPANPTHEGLVSQGWNWTLAQIKSQLTIAAYIHLYIGQQYITTSGNTEIDITLAKRLSPYLSLAVNGTVVINWGDNSSDTVTGTSLITQINTNHTYSSAGKYTISISPTSGEFSFYGTNTMGVLNANENTYRNRTYNSRIEAVRIGANITTIADYSLLFSYRLEYVTIPTTITSIGTYALQYAGISSITIPNGITSLGTYAFYASSLRTIAMANSLPSLSDFCFYTCNLLRSVVIPANTTILPQRYLANCYSLESAVIPSGITNIQAYAFSNALFSEIHFLSTTPPTLDNTNAFLNVQGDSIMYVPYSSDHSVLEAYQTATNWSTYASYMQEEPQS